MRVPEVPTQRDLSVLHTGASRTEVLAELGAPVWTEEHDQGAIDVFVFKQGYRKGVQAMRAIGLGAANLVSLGSKRSETDAALAAGAEVTVRVLYDETHHIDAVFVLEGEDALSRQQPLKSWLTAKPTQASPVRMSSSTSLRRSAN